MELKPWRHHQNKRRINAATNPELRQTRRCLGCKARKTIAAYPTPNSRYCDLCTDRREAERAARENQTDEGRQRLAYMAATAPLRNTPEIGRDGGWYGKHFD